MKKLLLLIGITLLLLGCVKEDPEPKFCWDCRYTLDELVIYKLEICNATPSEIRKYEKEHKVICTEKINNIK